MYQYQEFKSKSVLDNVLPIQGKVRGLPHRCCWNAPEFGVGLLRFLHCPELFFECKKGCRLEFCTLPRHCIHSALSHCSGPKNLGNQMKERENMTTQLKFQSAGKRGDEKRDRETTKQSENNKMATDISNNYEMEMD